MLQQSLYHTFQRYRTLHSHQIKALPIIILMPHSACNCRCVMCDIWKDNKNLKQLTEKDIEGLLSTLQKLGTKQVVMSGGEALLNPRFFSLCQMLKKRGLRITLLSTGIALKKNAELIVDWVDDVIVSLDGTPEVHDKIRNIPGAFTKMQEGIDAIRQLNAGYHITARTVIHRLNFSVCPAIIDTARKMGLHQISFLPADVSSHAFNREVPWSPERQNDVLIRKDELPLLRDIIDLLVADYAMDFGKGFIAESPGKIKNILQYYEAIHGLTDFPFKKCNAPWVSSVLEADGNVRPCFFHEAVGNIHQQSFEEILNGETAVNFRKQLDMEKNETCKRCVCYLNLSPRTNPADS
jgi:MoaA/NifB/PqqE/SkfB family radical SAM enzyme